MCHMSCVNCHLSHVTCHIKPAGPLEELEELTSLLLQKLSLHTLISFYGVIGLAIDVSPSALSKKQQLLTGGPGVWGQHLA